MLRRLLGLARKEPSGPPNSRAYAIGDVHGRLDLLERLLEEIARDDAARGPAKTWLVLLGDLIDRGPDSAGVLDYLIRRKPAFDRAVFLKGNHEEFLLDVLEGGEARIANWLVYGGFECAESYGISRGWAMNASPAEIAERLRAAVPPEHRAFLADMADSFRFGDYVFVHAGIRPGVPLHEQRGEDLRWIREDFLDHGGDHGAVIVHGHTIVEAPEERPNRIGIDTGAYKSGVLTALAIEGRERWYLTASGEGRAAA